MADWQGDLETFLSEHEQYESELANNRLEAQRGVPNFITMVAVQAMIDVREVLQRQGRDVEIRSDPSSAPPYAHIVVKKNEKIELDYKIEIRPQQNGVLPVVVTRSRDTAGQLIKGETLLRSHGATTVSDLSTFTRDEVREEIIHAYKNSEAFRRRI